MNGVDDGLKNKACGGDKCGADLSKVGQKCYAGDGDCQGEGVYECDPTQANNGFRCTAKEKAKTCGASCAPVPAQEDCTTPIDDNCNGKINDASEGCCVPSTEACNGKDDDCDSQVDEGAATCALTTSSISLGFQSTCAVLSDGTARCWGDNKDGQLGDGTTVAQTRPTPVLGLSSVAQVSVGANHACALLRDGAVHCWGSNGSAQLGNNTSGSLMPIQVQGVNRVLQIAASANSTCALLDGGTVSCWGSLGSTKTSTPVPYSGLAGVTELSVSLINGGGCARLTSGQVTCWASGGQPTLVPGISGAVSVGMGYSHACAALSDGTVRCWSRGGGEQALVISGAAAISSAAAVAVGFDFACARLRSGRVRCWGDNNNAFGTGMGGTSSAISGVDASALAVGHAHACALTKTASISCWGDNTGGEIGDGAPDFKYEPVTVLGIP